MSTRKYCALCGHDSGALEPILDLGMSPIADVFPDDYATACKVDTYPLDLERCGNCGLVQLSEVVPDDILWAGYGFHTGGSPALAQYFRDYALDVIAAQSGNGADPTQQLVVEIACNDGTMLQHFAAAAYRTLGVEPSTPQARVAEARGLDVVTQPFTDDLADTIRGGFGQADVIIANNVLAHVADPLDFANGLKLLLSPSGTAYVEVQYLGDLIAGNGFDMIYHQHRSYFSLHTLGRLLNRVGLQIVAAKRVPAQSGSLRVEIRHAPIGRRPSAVELHLSRMAMQAGILGTERWLATSDAYGGLQLRAETIASRLVEAMRDGVGPTYAMGASAKATTLLNWTGAGAFVDGVIDATPSKFGRYLPVGSMGALPIGGEPGLSRTEGRETRLLTAHNYAGQIVRRLLGQDGPMPRIVIPLPGVIVL